MRQDPEPRRSAFECTCKEKSIRRLRNGQRPSPHARVSLSSTCPPTGALRTLCTARGNCWHHDAAWYSGHTPSFAAKHLPLRGSANRVHAAAYSGMGAEGKRKPSKGQIDFEIRSGTRSAAGRPYPGALARMFLLTIVSRATYADVNRIKRHFTICSRWRMDSGKGAPGSTGEHEEQCRSPDSGLRREETGKVETGRET